MIDYRFLYVRCADSLPSWVWIQNLFQKEDLALLKKSQKLFYVTRDVCCIISYNAHPYFTKG